MSAYRTPETAAAFVRDIEACRNMQGRDATFIAQAVSAEEYKQALYDSRFAEMLAQVRAINNGLDRTAVCWLLSALGGTHCRSGTPQFGAAVDLLTRYGVQNATGVFEHDRVAIAAMCAEQKAEAA